MRVIGFEDESDFLVSKQLEGLPMKHSVREIKQPTKNSISFQGTNGLSNHTERFRTTSDVKKDIE
jgi:hypothetical protein